MNYLQTEHSHLSCCTYTMYSLIPQTKLHLWILSWPVPTLQRSPLPCFLYKREYQSLLVDRWISFLWKSVKTLPLNVVFISVQRWYFHSWIPVYRIGEQTLSVMNKHVWYRINDEDHLHSFEQHRASISQLSNGKHLVNILYWYIPTPSVFF